jgi:hypothetical protein
MIINNRPTKRRHVDASGALAAAGGAQVMAAPARVGRWLPPRTGKRPAGVWLLGLPSRHAARPVNSTIIICWRVRTTSPASAGRAAQNPYAVCRPHTGDLTGAADALPPFAVRLAGAEERRFLMGAMFFDF